MKQETLEEAAYEYSGPYRCPATNENEYCKHDIISAFNNGAKWQQERSYSEEDIEKAFKVGFTLGYVGDTLIAEKDKCFNRWFKIFKDNQNEKK